MGASNGMNLQVMGVLHGTAPPANGESYEAAPPAMGVTVATAPPAMGAFYGSSSGGRLSQGSFSRNGLLERPDEWKVGTRCFIHTILELLEYQTSIFSFSFSSFSWTPAVRPRRIGIENDVIPNVSGADYCYVLSWPLLRKACLAHFFPSACILLEKIRKNTIPYSFRGTTRFVL